MRFCNNFKNVLFFIWKHINKDIEQEPPTFQAFKFRINPTDSQIELLNKHFGCSRFIYNHFLALKQERYAFDKTSVNFNKCCKILTELKQEPETAWLKEVNSQTIQQSLKNLDVAYDRFFKKTSGFPKFKRKSDSNQSFRVPQHIKVENNIIRIPKFNEGIKINLHRKLEGDIKSATFSKTPSGKYFVSILCVVSKKAKPKTGKRLSHYLAGEWECWQSPAILQIGRRQNWPCGKVNRASRTSLKCIAPPCC